jgi:hypothetical protein
MRNSLRHGQGTFTFPSEYGWEEDGSYVGEWKDDNAHGQGTYTFPDGRIWEGTFDNGELVSGDKYDNIVVKKETQLARERQSLARERQSEREIKAKSLEESNDNIRLALDILNYTLMGDKKK